jgi:O-methyltransferase
MSTAAETAPGIVRASQPSVRPPAARVALNPLLKAHIGVVDAGTVLVGIGQRAGVRDLTIQMGLHYPAMTLHTIVIDRREPAERHFQMVEDAVRELVASGQRALVLLADASTTDLLYLHKISGPAKEASLRVVSCFARPIYRGALLNTGGLTYESMFFRAGMIARAQREPGDYLEFGVFDGRTTSLAWQAMKDIRPMRFFGFDTYKGIAGALAQEISFPDGSYYSNLETYWHNMKVAGADPARVRPVQGNFLETFTNPAALQATLGIERCLVAHIDCDVYSAAKASLDFVTNILVQGSVLLFDEFHANNASNQLGERRALREWLAENPHIEVERWMDYAAVGRAFFVHIDAERT